MGFLTSLFGGTGTTIVTVLFALGIVLVLIVLGVWALKLLFQATGNVGRGNNRRLSVIDSTAIDPKRQLVLIRRDDVEHLLVLGGPQDMVVETAITPPPEPEPVKRPKRRIIPSQKSEPAKQVEPTDPPAPTPPKQSIPAETPVLAASTVSAATSANANSAAETASSTTQTGKTNSPRRRLTSLRHTGLLRPASRVEPELHPQPSNDQNQIDNEEISDSDTKSAEIDAETPETASVEAPKTTDESGSDSQSENKTAPEPKSGQ